MNIEKFLKQRAVKISVSGSYTLPNWYDAAGQPRAFACRTRRVSPFRVLVDAPVPGRIGDQFTSFFSDFGKFDCHVSDISPGGFLMELDTTAQTRKVLSQKLTWLEQRENDPSIQDRRDHARFIPEVPHSTLLFADGSTYPCFIIDISVSGVAVSSTVEPELGTPLSVGACVGRVARIFADGFAIKFVEQQRRIEVERLVTHAPKASPARMVPNAPRLQRLQKMS
ncbi:PilZ domain-containing protein [Bradyrhizobium sp. G127]|jgi:hypothetical protein|uniref:PilZ domain-containing protein n=1 Tax=Bradyrhizobium sp. G127 TaxID=2904800 RepID=UPI001F1676F8|nr:PilZ domain-containing protein [Bradyrhizobium sp. G127]MCF2522894.1 PilZ domain-containing protein [Bradyrhizobium sp. G127]